MKNNDKFCFFTDGVNIIRIPVKDFEEQIIDDEHLEVLTWLNTHSYEFRVNDLSKNISENVEIYDLKKYDSETDIFEELGIEYEPKINIPHIIMNPYQDISTSLRHYATVFPNSKPLKIQQVGSFRVTKTRREKVNKKLRVIKESK